MEDKRIHQPRDWQRVAQCRENLMDLDIVVDDARRELDSALDHLDHARETFRAAVTARDAEAQLLADLIRRSAA